MKKITLLCTVIAVLGLAACEKKAEKTTETPVETTTPATPPEAATPTSTSPATPAKPAAKTNPDGTTIDVSNTGVSVGTKKAGSETNVNLSKDSGRIQIKMPR